MKQQTIERKDNDFMKEVCVWDSHHIPSWKKTGPGSAELRVKAHHVADWLMVTMSEYYRPEEGRTTARETMMTLDKPAALALRDMLNEVYGTE